HHKTNQRISLRRQLRQELLGSRSNRFRRRLDLELRHRLDVHGDALVRVEILHGRDVEAHELEAELLSAMEEGKHQLRAALHDVRSAKTVANERLVRADLA